MGGYVHRHIILKIRPRGVFANLLLIYFHLQLHTHSKGVSPRPFTSRNQLLVRRIVTLPLRNSLTPAWRRRGESEEGAGSPSCSCCVLISGRQSLPHFS